MVSSSILSISDPNWLLSSTAQSAAALVAIVGGFLAARVIAFNSDRDSVRRRLASTERDRENAKKLEAAGKEELDEWNKGNPPRSAPSTQQGGGGISVGVWSGSDAVRDAATNQQRKDLESRTTDATLRFLRLTLDRDQIQRELQSLEIPSDLKRGFRVLVFFAFSGVVLPIILMATQPSTVSVLWRTLVVAGFVVGLLGLADFISSVIAAAEGRKRKFRRR